MATQKTQGKTEFLQDDARLHKLCHDGNLKKVTEFVEKLNNGELAEKLANRKGVFGYTPLHEAVASGSVEVLDYLLRKTNNAHVNCRANSGYTPLHLAASLGHVDCVEELLEHSADISITDENGKTPKQIAKRSYKGASIVRLLRSEEIIREVETDGDKLDELLKNNTQFLKPYCLDRALMAATKNDNHFNIGKLVMKGAKNLDDCLEYALRENKPHACAMLLFIQAALSGNRTIVQRLFEETVDKPNNSEEFPDTNFPDVQEAVLSGKVSTVVPIELAWRNRHLQVHEELLLKTGVNQEEGYVYWHGLKLLQLKVPWLRRIHWVKRLVLARNGFKSLPDEMGNYLKQVVKMDLQHNELTTIPRCLLELPCLGKLNLSHNKLTKLPSIPEWSACLTVLDLSHNKLHSLSINTVASSIHSLDLSHNLFYSVPLCICSFVTLHSLNLSDNPKICSLPTEMGRLNMLSRLYLDNLKNLKDPPRDIQKEPRDCIRYLNSKLRCVKGFYQMNLMVVGMANRGKTTLVKILQGKECGNDESTVGVDVSEWWYRPSLRRRPFHFRIWDFVGQEEYNATYQCFLSRRSLYLLLFNLIDGDAGVQELKPWLNNLALRAPRSCVIIIGTHLDQVPEEKREDIDDLLQRVGDLANMYTTKLQIVEVMPVALKNCLENIGLLKEAVYNYAANYKTHTGQLIMGQKVPVSYHTLNKQLEKIQQEARHQMRQPIMHAEEFNAMVQQLNLADLQDKEELKTAVLFLTDVGSLLHYNDPSHNLHELYFVDLHWLCNMMSKAVTIKGQNPVVKKGILYSKDIPMLFKDEEFPWKYFEQFLTLLDKLEIALPLDNRRVLIPSLLPEECPKQLEKCVLSSILVYSRHIIFRSADTPPGFWSRLLSTIMHSIPQIIFALDKTTPTTLLEESPSFEADEEDSEVGFSLNTQIPPSSRIPSMKDKSSGQFMRSEADSCDFSLSQSTSVSPTVNGKSELETSSLPHAPPPAPPPPPNPEIRRRMKQDSFDQQIHGAPQLLPNPPSTLPLHMCESDNVKEIELEYWRTGLYYYDSEVMFRIESLAKNLQNKGKKEGVLIMTSSNDPGKKIIGQLVDLVLSLISEWFPGLSNLLEQRVPCFECVKLGAVKPFEFQVEQCLPVIAQNKTSIECGSNRGEHAINHTVALTDIVPDLLLHDINPKFFLSPDDIDCLEDNASLLGKGGFSKVYRGKCRNQSVAIKKYITKSKDAFTELHSEAKFLQQCHHPCLVSLVGVCIHPIMALVLEEAPLKSLEFPLLKKKLPFHRLTIFRIAAEVAAALHFLHGQGIIFRDLKAANVLLWTLDPASLCHCKVTDFGIATHMANMSARGLQGTVGFIAPEVLYIWRRGQCSVYDHRADIFSFGMFLYQMIARRHPYHDFPSLHDIVVSVKHGERPMLHDIDIASTGFHYLTMLMKKCWEDNPKNRPSTEEIIRTVCRAPVQSVMCVHPVRSKYSLRQAIALIPANFTKAGAPTKLHNELWVCCDGAEGAELNIYNAHTMVKVCKNFIKDNQVQCMALCNNHIWVGSRAGIEYGVIDVFNIATRDLVHFRLRENSVSCLTAAKDRVLIGTLEGYCFSFSNDVARIGENADPHYKYVSEHAINGIAYINKFIWVSHTRYISFLNPDNLALEGFVSHDEERDAFVGQLSAAPAEDIIWSAHLGGCILAAWDAHKRIHSFGINASRVLQNITNTTDIHNGVITAMVPALNTVWVGMGTGHIMVFHNEDLLTWFQPYKEYVRFLTLIPGSGPSEMEQCMIVSGGKSFNPLIRDLGSDYDKEDKKGQLLDKAGVLVIWEAFDAKTMRQIKLVEENSPGYLDTHDSVYQMILNGDFKDGTQITKTTENSDKNPTFQAPNSDTQTPDYFSTSLKIHLPGAEGTVHAS